MCATDRQTDRHEDDEENNKKETKKKKPRVKYRDEEEVAGGACELADQRGPLRPLTLIMTSEVSAQVRGCVKMPVRQFTPLLGDDDLMQPPPTV